MPSGNPSSILGQTILLFNSLNNLRLMIFRYNWFLSIVFLTAACGTLINSSLQITALLFFLIGSILLIDATPTSRHFNSQIGRAKNTAILASLIALCLFIPQVETNMANFKNPTDSLEARTRIV